LVIALASGANFVARAFSGDTRGTTETIIEAIKHPGFSFVQILSPCVTFRPDQREWRNMVRAAPVPTTDDPAKAARYIMTDDGFNLGILYKGDRPPSRSATGNRSKAGFNGEGSQALVKARTRQERQPWNSKAYQSCWPMHLPSRKKRRALCRACRDHGDPQQSGVGYSQDGEYWQLHVDAIREQISQRQLTNLPSTQYRWVGLGVRKQIGRCALPDEAAPGLVTGPDQ
jgi:hypothetical protein